MLNSNSPKISALITVISVFFFWGFVAASNDILIPVFKENLQLQQWQSQMISFAFYVAYTVGSVVYFFISKFLKGDILNKIGYKNGISLGLLISAFGTLLFYPAAQMGSFLLLILGLFIVGLGFSLQQIAANPLTINLGDPRKGSQRLSMAGGVNNLGTIIGPLIVSFAIFGSFSNINTNIENVKIPYLILGFSFVVVAIIFKLSSIPNKIVQNELNPNTTAIKEHKTVLKYPQLWMGMIGIFVYVGVEVSTAGNLPEFLRQHVYVTTDKVAPFVSLYWASLMIGRWASAVGTFNLNKKLKTIMNIFLPYLAFAVYLIVNKIANHDITPFYDYAYVIIVLILADMLSKGNPALQLIIFSSLGIIALFIGMLSDGMVSAYAFISVGLFCSTLWPCIFTLAIKGLGKNTNTASSFLIMMIMGGGIISVIQGALSSDNLLGIQWSYIVGVLCFFYLAFYGTWSYRKIWSHR